MLSMNVSRVKKNEYSKPSFKYSFLTKEHLLECSNPSKLIEIIILFMSNYNEVVGKYPMTSQWQIPTWLAFFLELKNANYWWDATLDYL